MQLDCDRVVSDATQDPSIVVGVCPCWPKALDCRRECGNPKRNATGGLHSLTKMYGPLGSPDILVLLGIPRMTFDGGGKSEKSECAAPLSLDGGVDASTVVSIPEL
eukprot:362758-Rhodomonas_salina.1